MSVSWIVNCVCCPVSRGFRVSVCKCPSGCRAWEGCASNHAYFLLPLGGLALRPFSLLFPSSNLWGPYPQALGAEMLSWLCPGIPSVTSSLWLP